jgi:hypothetical protein
MAYWHNSNGGSRQQQQDYIPYIPPQVTPDQQRGQPAYVWHGAPPSQLPENPFSRSLGAACQQLSASSNFVLKAGLAAGADSSSVDVKNHHLNFAIFCAGFKDKVLEGSLEHTVKMS